MCSSDGSQREVTYDKTTLLAFVCSLRAVDEVGLRDFPFRRTEEGGPFPRRLGQGFIRMMVRIDSHSTPRVVRVDVMTELVKRNS